MRATRILRFTLIGFIILFVLDSCVTTKDVNYLQDMTPDSQIEIEDRFVAVIVPYDELSIQVSSFDQELAKPFNISNNNSNNNGAGRYNSYLVDHNGNIQFPVLGEIRVAGMTRLQLQEHIAALLRAGNYIADPFVMVRFVNFKIFFLTPGGGKSISIPNERCTFLEALALAGGLDNYARRDNIAVLREVNGKMTMRYLDPRSSDIFNDPYYMLQQNDMILIESRHVKYFKNNLSEIAGWISLGTSLLSAIAVFLLYKNKQ